MPIFQISLFLSTLLCSLVAGFLLAFSVVVMPGIRTLNDHAMLQAFKVMDTVIQKGQPLFLLVWAGSVLAVIALAVFGLGRVEGADRLILGGAVALYLLGVQLPTAAVNVPLNNRLQILDLDTMDAPALTEARREFEPRWIRYNTLRTIAAVAVVALLLLLMLRL